MADIFGSDIACVFELDPGFRETTGNQMLGEAIARRWITPRGGILLDPNYGFDLNDYLDADVTAQDIARIQNSLEVEALKDQRIINATVQVSILNGNLVVNASLTTANGPFTLVVSVNNLNTTLLQVTTS